MARRSIHKPEPRKELPRIFLCETHHRAMEQLYYLDEVPTGQTPRPPAEARNNSEERNGGEWGVCFGCMKTAWGKLYAMEPRRARYRTGSGGGEREKARRDA